VQPSCHESISAVSKEPHHGVLGTMDNAETPGSLHRQWTPCSRSPHYQPFVYLAAALRHITELCLSLTQQSMTLGARNPRRTNPSLALPHEWAVTCCTSLFTPHHQGGQSAAHEAPHEEAPPPTRTPFLGSAALTLICEYSGSNCSVHRSCS